MLWQGRMKITTTMSITMNLSHVQLFKILLSWHQKWQPLLCLTCGNPGLPLSTWKRVPQQICPCKTMTCTVHYFAGKAWIFKAFTAVCILDIFSHSWMDFLFHKFDFTSATVSAMIWQIGIRGVSSKFCLALSLWNCNILKKQLPSLLAKRWQLVPFRTCKSWL